MPLPLSISIVCCNNEATIARTLDSIKDLAAEIVAVDSGSTDRTIEILERAGARVIHQDWRGHVKQKQFALDHCTQPWALHLDSDESVEPALAASIRAVIEANDPPTEKTADCYELNRKVWWHGPLNHAWQPEWRLRLVRKTTDGYAARWGGHDPHDALLPIDPAKPIGRLQGDLRHDSIDTIASFLAKQAAHARVSAESLAREGKRGSIARLVFSPFFAWFRQIVLRSAWRDGWRGWVAASCTGAATLMKHAALLERTHLHKNSLDKRNDSAEDRHQ